MAWFCYLCPECGEFKVSLPKREKTALCPICGMESKPQIKGGSMRVVERLDNGAMARRVERLNNIEEIMEERNRKYSNIQEDEEL